MNKKKFFNSKFLLNYSLYNKSTAFSESERDACNLEGLLPVGIESEENQVKRIELQIEKCKTNLDKFIYLANLQNINETLYYKIIMSHPTTYLPIVYDPVVGDACLKFHEIFQESRGIYISKKHKGKIKNLLQNWPEKDIRFIVITDGSRILGLGDLGANGMGIPIGKLALYTAVGSIPPHYTLPICFDMGTNNPTYLNDALYLGLRETRIEGKEYFDLMDEFVNSVQELYPYCCIQFEDFANFKAIPLLEKYQKSICMFNDDIQGTGSAILSGFYSAEKITGKKIKDHTILFLGAGSAAHGAADLICMAMEEEGLSKKEAINRCYMFDTNGLVVSSRPRLEEFKKKYSKNLTPELSFLECVKKIKPTAIIGVSTTPHLFTKEVIEEMAKNNDNPIIFPLSNPTSQSECTANEAYLYTKGKVLFAGGILWDPVVYNNHKYIPTQANNLWIFTSIGLAAYATKTKKITEYMFLIAAKSLSNQVTVDQIEQRMLFPDEKNIIEIVVKVAADIAKYIFDQKLARVDRPDHDDHIIYEIEKVAYHPYYNFLHKDVL